ncbi:hypothetical protein A7C99_1399 [Trichophyton rubrum]|uniref:Uncharacterized protein n=1 Tax=Trichophyton rubrum TaxID=5551 RepID=A0A178F6F6_TRIRU|nr:hypothetical protein A7C99_1399 [Trichophyton rubrum]
MATPWESNSSGPKYPAAACAPYRVQSTPGRTPDEMMLKEAGGKQVPTVWREFCQPKQESWVFPPLLPAYAESARRRPDARFARLLEPTAWR